MSEHKEGTPWLQTLPGILTGLAALVTALGGFYAVVYHRDTTSKADVSGPAAIASPSLGGPTASPKGDPLPADPSRPNGKRPLRPVLPIITPGKPVLPLPHSAVGPVLAGVAGKAPVVVKIVQPQPNPVHWEQTPASKMADVAVAESGTIWLTGFNGTVWHSNDGQNFTQEPKVSGFGRIGVGNDDGYVFAVGRDNHTLWRREGPGNWTQTASSVADVAIDHNDVVWIAGTNRKISYSTDKGRSFNPIDSDGFCRVGTHSQQLWAVGCNGTLWHYQRASGKWTPTDASLIADVAGDYTNSIWVAGTNGTAWTKAGSASNFESISPAAGFASIAVGRGKVYAVRTDGTLWRYRP